MRLDRNDDKWGALFKAKPRKPRVVRPTSQSPVDDEGIPLGTRLYKSAKDRKHEALDYERRRFRAYLEQRQRRIDRITSEVPDARRFIKTLEKVVPTANVIAYLDIDLDLAGLARQLQLTQVREDYDRFTLFEVAMEMVRRHARGTEFEFPDIDTLFEQTSMTALDELKQELRIN